MRFILLAVIAVLILPSGAANRQLGTLAEAGNEATIRQLEHDWESALVRRDDVTINRIVAEDCLFVSSTGELMTKTQADTDRLATTLQASTVTQMNVRIFGDVAVVIGKNVEMSKYADQDTSGQYRWTDVFARRGGRWQVVSAQSTRID